MSISRLRAEPGFRRTPVSLAAAMLFAGLPWSLSAQEAAPAESTVVTTRTDSEDAAGVGEIIVTATRRREGVQDIPINITAVTGEQIQQQKLENLADLVRTVPGLFLVDQGGRDANLLTVRGLNVDTISASEGVGTQGGGVVAQYIGDIPIYLDLRLFDIERVEALLGPQGTLYGAGTLGGAIRYLPNRPQFGENTLEMTGGSYGLSHSDDLASEFSVIGNIGISEKAAARVSMAFYNDPGYIDYNFVVRQPGVSNPQPDFNDPAAVAANLRKVPDANDQKTLLGRAAFRYAFTDTIESIVTATYQDQEAGARTVNHVDAFGTGKYESASRYLEPNDRETLLVSLETTADLGFASLTSATGYSNYSEVGQRDQTDLLLDFEYGYEDFPSFSAFTAEDAEEKNFTQELRLVSNADGPLNWIVGLFYKDFDSDATSSEFTPGIPEFFGVDRPDNLEYFQLTQQKSKEQAVFGEIGYDLTDKLTATVGGRFFKYEDDSNVGFALPLIDGSEPDEILLDAQPVSVSDNDSIFKANLSYTFNDRILSYLTVSEGYRTGGSNAVPACAEPLPPGQNVCALPNERLIAPDKTLNYELGFRSTWFNRRLIVNGSVYFIEWTDIQVSGTTVNGNIPITVNAAKAESSGVELSAQAVLSDRWSFNLNYAYNDAMLTQDAPGIVSGDDAFSGDRLPGSPQHQAHATLSYEQPLSNGMQVRANYGLAAQSDVYTRVGLRSNGESLGGYAIHDASLVLEARDWSLTLYAKNLFDRYAKTGVRSNPTQVRSIDGDADGDGVTDHSFALRSYYHSVLDPMRIGVTVTHRFGE